MPGIVVSEKSENHRDRYYDMLSESRGNKIIGTGILINKELELTN